jgi:hypothetical protein
MLGDQEKMNITEAELNQRAPVTCQMLIETGVDGEENLLQTTNFEVHEFPDSKIEIRRRKNENSEKEKTEDHDNINN